MEKINKKVAVLIDAENAASKHAKQIFDTMSNYGEIVVKRIFADWSRRNVSGWKEQIAEFSITTKQQFSFASKKNSSDLSLIIDAMVLLFERDIDIFCLVSSDSDFTRLVQELRERGKTVVGMGSRNAVKAFVNAFSEFFYLGEAEEGQEKDEKEDKEPEKPVVKTKPEPRQNEGREPRKRYLLSREQHKALKDIVNSLIDEDGTALYTKINVMMKAKYSDFVPQNFGCETVSKLIEKLLPELRDFKVGRRPIQGNEGAYIMYLERK